MCTYLLPLHVLRCVRGKPQKRFALAVASISTQHTNSHENKDDDNDDVVKDDIDKPRKTLFNAATQCLAILLINCQIKRGKQKSTLCQQQHRIISSHSQHIVPRLKLKVSLSMPTSIHNTICMRIECLTVQICKCLRTRSAYSAFASITF